MMGLLFKVIFKRVIIEIFLSLQKVFEIDEYVLELPCVKSVHIRRYSGPHVPAFGLNTERYEVSVSIQSDCGKMRTRITPNTDTFHAVQLLGLSVYWQDGGCNQPLQLILILIVPLCFVILYDLLFFTFFQIFSINVVTIIDFIFNICFINGGSVSLKVTNLLEIKFEKALSLQFY